MSNTSVREHIRRWFSHPFVGITGTIASVISILLAVFFFIKAAPSRELVVQETSARTVFVDKNVPSILEVSVQGQPIRQQDVFAVQFVIWNNGNQSIRPENILEPITFWPQDDTRVIEAKVVRRTRSVCRVNTEVAEGGSATVAWHILERNDGAIVQLVLVGDRSCRIRLAGTVEGGGRPNYQRHTARPGKNTPNRWTLLDSVTNYVLGSVFIAMLVYGSIYQLKLSARNWRARRGGAFGLLVPVGRAVFGLLLAIIVVSICAVVTYNWTTHRRAPDTLLSPPGFDTANNE